MKLLGGASPVSVNNAPGEPFGLESDVIDHLRCAPFELGDGLNSNLSGLVTERPSVAPEAAGGLDAGGEADTCDRLRRLRSVNAIDRGFEPQQLREVAGAE